MMSDDLLASIIPIFGCIIERTPEGVRLTGASRDSMMVVAITSKVLRPSFPLRTVAKTDSTQRAAVIATHKKLGVTEQESFNPLE